MDETKTEQKKIYIDLDGKGGGEADFERPPVIPEDSYNAVFLSSNLGEFADFKDKEKKVSKFIFQVGLEDFVHGGKEVVLPFYVKAVVTKAYNKSVSNSTLFDLLELSGLMPHFHKHYTELETEAAFKAFVEGNLIGRKARVSVETANRLSEDASKRYSKVKKVLRFLDAAPGLGKQPVVGPVSKDVTPEAQS